MGRRQGFCRCHVRRAGIGRAHLCRADPTAAEEIEQRPRFSLRAVKINLPWISYRKHECLQLHDETCRDLAFWKALIDHLAECRLNRLSLGVYTLGA